MKQFDLEEYLKKPHLNIVTRNGLHVRIVCTDKKTGTADRPILGLVKIDDNTEIAIEYTKEGKYDRKEDNDYDLFFAPKKGTGYVAVSKVGEFSRCVSGIVFDTPKEVKNATRDYIAIAKIEWEE